MVFRRDTGKIHLLFQTESAYTGVYQYPCIIEESAAQGKNTVSAFQRGRPATDELSVRGAVRAGYGALPGKF